MYVHALYLAKRQACCVSCQLCLPANYVYTRQGREILTAGCMQVGFFQNMTNLVEHAVESNEGQAATIVAHSLGCLVSLSFLTGKSQEWLDKHVSSLVAISAPWGGSVTALKGVLLALYCLHGICSPCNGRCYS